MSARQEWKRAHRAKRIGKLDGKPLWAAIAAATGVVGAFDRGGRGVHALRLQQALSWGEPVDLRWRLQYDLLNAFGHLNPFRSPPMSSPRYAGWQRTSRRARDLRERLLARGLIITVSGGYVSALIATRREGLESNVA